jgi:predicted RNase H-like HicB family nuclease
MKNSATRALARLSSAWYTFDQMKSYHLTAVIWKEGKSYVSKCPELGVASCGATPEKARAALEEAVQLFLSNAKRLGILKDVEPALVSSARFTTPLEVAAL